MKLETTRPFGSNYLGDDHGLLFLLRSAHLGHAGASKSTHLGVIVPKARLARMKVEKRDRLHRLVEELPEKEVRAAERYLEYLRLVAEDPFLHAFLTAPVDDEPLTPEEEAALREAHDAVARSEVESWANVRAEILGQD